jgi:hypothetical protein
MVLALVHEQSTPEGTETEPGAVPDRMGEPLDDRPPGDRISVGSGDEMVARIQLAARWAEAFAPEDSDSLEETLRRFYRAYSYIDAVTHGVAPEEESAPGR